MIDQIKSIIEPIKRRILNLISRGQLLKVDDSKGIQRIDANFFSDEVHTNIERIQNYGFTSNPKPGCEVVTLFHSGNREHGIVIAIDDKKFRLKNLAAGEVAIYTDEGDNIHFKRNNKIEITTKELIINAADKVIVNTKDAEVNSSTSAKVVSPSVQVQANNTEITSPSITMTASTSVVMTTPNLNVSGLISCAGIGAGVAPAAGKAKVAGDIESTGNVKDSLGTMADIRSKYNSHYHDSPSEADPTPQM